MNRQQMKENNASLSVYEQLQKLSDFKMLEEIIAEWLNNKELAIRIYKLRWIRRTRINLIPWLVLALLFITFIK